GAPPRPRRGAGPAPPPPPRLGERAAEVALSLASPLLLGPLRALRPTPAEAVATALVETAAARPTGVHVYDPEAIRQAAADP
ncbi:MAG: hypothetical protein AAF845_20525, partial [Bacteroidota bacterium]